MPALQRGQAYRLDGGRWGLRYYQDGNRRRVSPFPTKSAAFKHFRDVIEPRYAAKLSPRAELTFAELVDVYLERHGQLRSPATIRTLRHRLARPLAAYGDVTLRELEGMGGDLADFRATLPPRFAHDVMRALAADVRRRRPLRLHGRRTRPSPRATTRRRSRGRCARTRSPNWTRSRPSLAPTTGRSSRSSRRPGCGRWSGRCSSGATSTVRAAC